MRRNDRFKKIQIVYLPQVRTYGTGKRVAIITYGNGVLASLQARAALSEQDITVIDVPYLSRVPTGSDEYFSCP